MQPINLTDFEHRMLRETVQRGDLVDQAGAHIQALQEQIKERDDHIGTLEGLLKDAGIEFTPMGQEAPEQPLPARSTRLRTPVEPVNPPPPEHFTVEPGPLDAPAESDVAPAESAVQSPPVPRKDGAVLPKDMAAV